MINNFRFSVCINIADVLLAIADFCIRQANTALAVSRPARAYLEGGRQ